MTRKWFIEDEEVTFTQVIKEAEKYGYGSDGDGFLCTSEASKILKENGISVRCEEMP